MKKTNFTRRDFNRLSTAAFGGMMAGTMIGCQPNDDGGGDANIEGSDNKDADPEGGGSESAAALSDVNICRGLNFCQGKGKGGENACLGQGACATAAAHDCHAQNECKGQGGCGESPGENECKGKGECGVPLKASKWADVRKAFEDRMEAEGKNIGDAPLAG